MPTWKFFVLGNDKTPLPNCAGCADAGPEHDRESCTCLTCHAFYAATDDPKRLEYMQLYHPNGAWAVRTGRESGIIVIDAEGSGTPSGVDVLDDWEAWVGGWPLTPTDRIASTPSGGVHRYYEYVSGVRSRNRVLPGVDIKSDGGYVVIPTGRESGEDGRRWLLDGRPGAPDDRLVDWLRSARGRSSGGGEAAIGRPGVDGYDYDRFAREGCPDGVRDEFFNELIFRYRKAGVDRAVAVGLVREHWKRAAQPPDARWYMPWHHVEYKIERIWRTVEPDRVADELAAWARAQVTTPDGRTGRVTLAPRSGS